MHKKVLRFRTFRNQRLRTFLDMPNISVAPAHRGEMELRFYVFESITYLAQNGHARTGRLTPLSH